MSSIEQIHPEDQNAPSDIGSQTAVNRPVVFLGGYGYDHARNLEVSQKLMAAAGYSEVIVIPDLPQKSKDGVVIYRYADGSERRLPGKLALKHLDGDDSEVRYTKLHEERARQLIAAIEERGVVSVDAVFQSADVSTGILAMLEKPGLFERVVLMDPSSIIKLPSRRKFLQEVWRDGTLVEMIKSKKNTEALDRFEAKPNLLRRVMRSRASRQNGNVIATYVSYQATMLHEIAHAAHAPDLAIIASQYDHAYNPLRILDSLVSLDDIQGFFVTNMRHGLAGKQVRLEQLVAVLQQTGKDTPNFTEKLHFFKDVSDDYRQKVLDIIESRM